MMPVNHVQSRVCHVTVLADAGSLPRSESNRMLTALDLTATGVTVNKQCLKVTHSSFNIRFVITTWPCYCLFLCACFLQTCVCMYVCSEMAAFYSPFVRESRCACVGLSVWPCAEGSKVT